MPKQEKITLNKYGRMRLKYLKEHKNIIKSLDLVEYNPLLDIDNRTLNIATNLLNIFLKEK